MSDKKTSVIQTRVAFLCANFSRTFANHFEGMDVGGYLPVLQEPAGPSTGGGAHARQPLLLQSADGGLSVGVGWANVSTKEAMVRSYESVRAVHEKRAPKGAAELDKARYQAFVAAARAFFAMRGMSVSVEGEVAER